MPWDFALDVAAEVAKHGTNAYSMKPKEDELWQSGFDDVERRPYITQRWPENFVEIHPDDAKKRGIESGDYVMMYSD